MQHKLVLFKIIMLEALVKEEIINTQAQNILVAVQVMVLLGQ